MQYKPQNKEELEKLVNDESIYLGDIDTSLITDMSFLFEDTERKDFSGIEKWDVGKVEDMREMFAGATTFNQPLEKWDVSGVKDMAYMFNGARRFNQPLDSWDVSGVETMIGMFMQANSFNQPLEKWDVSRVESMADMFNGANSFNQPLEKWDVSKVRSMRRMFNGARSFNQDISNWNVRPKYKDNVFYECAIDEKFKPKALQNNQRKNNRGRGR